MTDPNAGIVKKDDAAAAAPLPAKGNGTPLVPANYTGDLPKYLITLLAIAGIIYFRLNKFEMQWTEVVLFALGIIPWFSSFTESFKLGKDGFETVFRKIEEAKTEIKAEVKSETEKIAAETSEQIAEVTERNSVTQSIVAFGTGGKTAQPVKEYREKLQAAAEDPADPQKGKWGGKPIDEAAHRKLTARIGNLPNENYFRRVVLRVESTDAANFPLTDNVRFHLHPTFARPVIEVKPQDNAAEVSLVAYGAFTVGAETDGGNTRLELDLAELGKDSDDLFFTR
jgi:hypothetical protein